MNTSIDTPRVTGLWVGDCLPPLAELCLRSYVANGVGFQLFTYRHYPNVPEGVLVRDAGEILPEECVFIHKNGSLAPFADWFRYTWMAREGGFWSDLDVICLTPNVPRELPWFARENEDAVAIGAFGFPAGHPLTAHLSRLGEDPSSPMPWDTDEEREAREKFLRETPEVGARRRECAWGIAGPGAFSRALAYYGLEGGAAPQESTYPLPYTVWRRYYDGSLGLDSFDTKKTWGLHVWGEMLRYEPDALENMHPESIVARLMERYGPFPPAGWRDNRRKVSIIVGICSCLPAKKRREAVRETWLKHPQEGVECLFFVGDSAPPPGEESDTVALPADDSYDRLPEKVLAFFRYALANYDFDWLFKCDDDTYLSLERLPSLARPGLDMVGDMSLQKRGAPSGGAGYLLSREMVRKIVAHPGIPLSGPEDVIFGELAIRLGGVPWATERLGMYCAPFPRQDNDMVTAHWCSPDKLRSIECFYRQAPFAEYSARHGHWEDDVCFYPNGLFCRRVAGCAGRYSGDGINQLVLHWFDWEAEFLQKTPGGYKGEMLSLERSGEQPELASMKISAPLLRELPESGCLLQIGPSKMGVPGWNLPGDLPFGVKQLSRYSGGSVDACYMENAGNIPAAELYATLREARRILKPGGIFRFCFPDLTRLCPDVSAADTPQRIQSFMQTHAPRVLWTTSNLQMTAESLGFEVSEPFPLAGAELGPVESLLDEGFVCLDAKKPCEKQ